MNILADPDDEPFITMSDAAQIAQCSVQKLYRLNRSGKLESRKFGGTFLLRRDAFYRMIGVTPDMYRRS